MILLLTIEEPLIAQLIYKQLENNQNYRFKCYILQQ